MSNPDKKPKLGIIAAVLGVAVVLVMAVAVVLVVNLSKNLAMPAGNNIAQTTDTPNPSTVSNATAISPTPTQNAQASNEQQILQPPMGL